jgi:hypothetical protein
MPAAISFRARDQAGRGRILFALDALDRRKPQERRRSATTGHRFGLNMDFANYRAGASSLVDDI